ncbi:MAG: outer membrane beta-barrel family protein [Muribaculaceae bacterium]
MKKLILSFIFTFYMVSIYANVRISGSVTGLKINEPYTLKIVSDSDSIQATFLDKNFSFEMNANRRIVLTLSASGYKSIINEYNVENSSNIKIKEANFVKDQSIELQEVVVLGKKMNISRDGGNYKINNIQGSYLSKTGTYIDMLGRTPGVFVFMKDKVMIAGAGEPTIYVNERKVTNNSELYMLQSDNVKSIEIIKQPGSEYNSQINCVIKIETTKPLKDYVGVRFSNYLDICRKVSNTSILNFNIKSGKLSNNTSVSYAYNNSLHYSTDEEKVYEKTLLLKTINSDKASSRKANDIIVFSGFNYVINKNNTLYLQYNGQFTLSNKLDKINHAITGFNPTTDSNFFSEITHKPHTYWNTIEVAYTSNFANKQSIDLDFSYTNRKSDDNGNSKVFSEGSISNLLLKNKGSYDIYSFTGKYNFSFVGSDKETFGVEGAITNGNTSSFIGADYTENCRKSKYFASFYSFEKLWGKLKADFSLRYEYNNISNINITTKDYSNLLPKLRLSYKFNDNISVATRYSKRVKRPTLGELNPMIVYSDSLHFSQGNPNLSISTSDKYELTFNMKDISLTAFYLRTKNPIRWITDLVDNSMVYMPKNLSNSQEFNITADYFYNNQKNINLGINAQVIFPKCSYTFQNTLITESKIYGTFYVSFNYSFTKNLSAYVMINYTTPHDEMMTHYGAAFLLNAGVSLNLLKDKLRLSLSGSDLTSKGYTPWFRKNYMNTSIYHTNKYDIRGVSFSISYNINKIKTKYRKYNSNYELWEQGSDDIPKE